MGEGKKNLVELVLSKLATDEKLRNRFLNSPMAVIVELTGGPVDQLTLEAIGDRLRKRFSERELAESELDQTIGGIGRLQTRKPVIGSIGVSPVTFTMT